MEDIQKEKSANPQQPALRGNQPVRRHANWGLRFSLIFAIATIVLILICSWMWKLNNFRADELSNTIAQLKATESQAKSNQQAMQAMTQVISAPDTVRVTLAHQAGTPPGTADVYYNARMGVVVYTGVIAPAPSGQSYQLWLVPDSGAPVSAGLVEADQQKGAAVAHLPQGLSAKAFAVTLEPKGGRPQPTGPKVLVGAVGNA